MKKERQMLLLRLCLAALTAGSVHVFAQEKQITSESKSSTEATRLKTLRAAEANQQKARRDAERVELKATRAAAVERLKVHRAMRAEQLNVKRAIRASQLKPPPEGTFKFVSSKLNLGKPVKGAPYSATAITESIQTLSDGNQIIHRDEATYYRDSEGRTRIEQTLKKIGKWVAVGDPKRIVMISDPVAGYSYSLDANEHKATKSALLNKAVRPGFQQAETERQKRALERQRQDLEQQRLKQGRNFEERWEKPREAPPGLVKGSENLGMRVVEGVEAEGIRRTVSIPAGEIGNTREINLVDESWYSRELQVQVMSRHHDPRFCDYVFRLTNIKRSEPARSLFEVPADYTIVESSRPPFSYEQRKLNLDTKPAAPHPPKPPRSSPESAKPALPKSP